MLLLDNILVRIHEWRDQSEDPDLVVRFRRLWRAKADVRPRTIPRPHPIPARLAFDDAALTRLRRAG
jgi:hypothetical protein